MNKNKYIYIYIYIATRLSSTVFKGGTAVRRLPARVCGSQHLVTIQPQAPDSEQLTNVRGLRAYKVYVVQRWKAWSCDDISTGACQRCASESLPVQGANLRRNSVSTPRQHPSEACSFRRSILLRAAKLLNTAREELPSKTQMILEPNY